MKLTATALAFLGATASLITAAPLNINITSTTIMALDTREEIRPHCGEWRSFGCTIDSAWAANWTESYRECMWKHGCDPDDGYSVDLNLDERVSE